MVARVLDVAVADALRHHRPDHRVGAHDEVDHDRTVIGVERELDGRVDLVFLLDADREAPVRLGQLDEVGDAARAVARVQVGVCLLYTSPNPRD